MPRDTSGAFNFAVTQSPNTPVYMGIPGMADKPPLVSVPTYSGYTTAPATVTTPANTNYGLGPNITYSPWMPSATAYQGTSIGVGGTEGQHYRAYRYQYIYNPATGRTMSVIETNRLGADVLNNPSATGNGMNMGAYAGPRWLPSLATWKIGPGK